MDLVDEVSRDRSAETLIFCSHPAVVTIGRGTLPGDVFGWSGEIIEVNRGGRATYHGPSQIVVYPILDLNCRGRDLHRYMRSLEDAVVSAVSEFGIVATGRKSDFSETNAITQTDTKIEAKIEATGVWVGKRKIASIGIGVRRWVSFHGLALNVRHDPEAFRGMKPCGFSTDTMTSMEDIVGSDVDRNKLKLILNRSLIQKLQIENFNPTEVSG